MIFRVIDTLLRGGMVILLANVFSQSALAQETIQLIDIKALAPTIVVELRYAGANNIVGRPLYPRGTRAMVRPEVAKRLALVEDFLRRHQHGLKIWDAYRPKSVQVQLWQASRMNEYVADPDTTNGSLHCWGLAVDATLVDYRNKPVPMPTDFDDFTPAAFWHYQGDNQYVRANLALLQKAMAQAGFYGLRAEWWHFITPDWKKYVPDPNFDFSSRPPEQKNKS
ncbi:MAG: zinc D-Ala-D-Ala dipeptidase [Verrucomicrobiota bacterium]